MGKDEYINICRPSATWFCSKCVFPLLQEADIHDFAYNTSTQVHDQANFQSPIHLKRGMRIAHLNVNRILNKWDGVRDLLSDYNLDVLALSETWLTTDISDDETNISGYSIARKDRYGLTKRCGGGVNIYLSFWDLMSHLMILRSHDRNVNCKPLLVASDYRSPDLNVVDLINSLNSNFSTLKK